MQKILLSILLLWHTAYSQGQLQFESVNSIANKSLKGFVFKVINDVHSYFQCYRECDDHEACFSVNFYPSKAVCELNYASHVSHPKNMTDEDGGTYLFNPARREDISRSAKLPAKTCKILKDSYPVLPSSSYWLDLGNGTFLSYCDMETTGGGWTLVWSFTFNNYQDFKNKTNYVKPVPTNMYRNALEESNIPPKNETDMNAIDFKIWEAIGDEFLIKSNINNWVACLPNGGSLVSKTKGSLNCRFIKQIVLQPNCTEVPGALRVKNNNGNIVLEGKTTERQMFIFSGGANNWPTHDPCALHQPNHMKNVSNPRSNIYIR